MTPSLIKGDTLKDTFMAYQYKREPLDSHWANELACERSEGKLVIWSLLGVRPYCRREVLSAIATI